MCDRIMKTKAILATAYAVVCLAGSTATAEACGCGGTGPSPASFRSSVQVFIGRVLRVDRPLPRSSKNPDGSVRVAVGSGPISSVFEVKQMFRGTAERQVVLTGYGSSCDFDFRAGETWVVYAVREAGGLTTHKCLRTRLASEATEDLKYLEGLVKGRPQGVVYGTVFQRLPNADGGFGQGALLETADVVAVGAGHRFSAKTDRWGPFQLVLPPGEYEVWVERADGVRTTSSMIRILNGDEQERSFTVELK
jgi:hypothetical protein